MNDILFEVGSDMSSSVNVCSIEDTSELASGQSSRPQSGSRSSDSSMKYILVTGGVMSGIGKGVVASSIGALLRFHNFYVTCIKVDPYINIDAGCFSPYEHGEVFVLDDGGEVDLDLGNYERFLDVKLKRDNNITTGKIYQQVISRERAGEFLGKTVQVVPHITDAIQDWIERVAHEPVNQSCHVPQVCIIELGGTVGDIESMSFIEALHQFQFRVGRDNFCTVHVSLVPRPNAVGEYKTKPTQASIRDLRGLGLSPDLIVCRSEGKVGEFVKNKISRYCQVKTKQVINLPDSPSVYHVPIIMQSEGLLHQLSERLNLGLVGDVTLQLSAFRRWRRMVNRMCCKPGQNQEVRIALIGKYVKLEDAYLSVVKALRYAAFAVDRRLVIDFIESSDLEPIEADSGEQNSASNSQENKSGRAVQYHEAWKALCSADGIIVPGGFGSRGIEGKIRAIQWARTEGKPFLGICLGMQCAVIEFARNVLNYKDAHSTEICPETTTPVVIDMPEHNVDGHLGGTMRLGKKKSVFHNVPDGPKSEAKQSGVHKSIIHCLYGCPATVEERHRHRFEVNPDFVDELERAGLKFVARDEGNTRMEVMELVPETRSETAEPQYFVATQYHPEYLSRPMQPSPPYLGLLLASCQRLGHFLACMQSRQNVVKSNGSSANTYKTDDPLSDESDADFENICCLARSISECQLRQD